MESQPATGSVVYLIPLPIADNLLSTLSADVSLVTSRLGRYFVENARSARRFLRALHPDLPLEPIAFSEINKHEGADTVLFRKCLSSHLEIGIMSESGCPGIADPGAELVAIAHEMGAKVVPLSGPSSLLMALMASGLNGQSFAFNGYLPVKEPQRSKRIQDLEARSLKEGQTQIVIETPYRNNTLLADLLKHCKPTTRICIAQNLSSEQEYIQTKTVKMWQQQQPILEKSPAVFLFLGS